MTTEDTTLERARSAAADRAWDDAYALLTEADAGGPIEVADLETLAVAAYMVGRDGDAVAALEQAYRRNLDSGSELRAVRNAFWIVMNLALRGEWEAASGWLGRAQRTLERHEGDTAESGYLLMPKVMQAAMGGHHAAAIDGARQVIEIGERHREHDLVAMALHAQGRASIIAGDLENGLRLLDEAMVAVLADDLSPIVSGMIYCGVIEGCRSVQEVRRAHRWTEALTRWCDGQSGMVAFTGQCLTHRAELLQLRGQWADALDEARQAGLRFHDGMNQFPAAQAHYRQGELHRLRGEQAEAEAAYEAAGRWAWSPQPGVALLLLQQGRPGAAASSVATALAASSDPFDRARLLPAAVTIRVAAGDLAGARAGLDELDGIITEYPTESVVAAAAMARGEVLAAEGAAEEALSAFHAAISVWSQLAAPYEVAVARLALAEVCAGLGDTETAQREARAALAVFTRLEARPAIADAQRVLGARSTAAGLSTRESEVLALVAEGRTNREIASELVLSERTVDRHVSNILTKLGVATRTAATSYAYEHGLV